MFPLLSLDSNKSGRLYSKEPQSMAVPHTLARYKLIKSKINIARYSASHRLLFSEPYTIVAVSSVGDMLFGISMLSGNPQDAIYWFCMSCSSTRIGRFVDKLATTWNDSRNLRSYVFPTRLNHYTIFCRKNVIESAPAFRAKSFCCSFFTSQNSACSGSSKKGLRRCSC